MASSTSTSSAAAPAATSDSPSTCLLPSSNTPRYQVLPSRNAIAYERSLSLSLSSVVCKQCNAELADDSAKYAISALGSKWHKDCFKYVCMSPFLLACHPLARSLTPGSMMLLLRSCCVCSQRLFSFAKFFNRGGYPVCKLCNDKENPECGTTPSTLTGCKLLRL